MNISYKKWNTLLGWLMFLVATITYLLTLEPNFSFWDCGEYISSAAKLEVTHSPGAATFQLLGAVFSIFALGNPAQYPMIINAMSAIMSAFTILFMFWTITHFMRKALRLSDDVTTYTQQDSIVTLGAGIIGSLVFTFSDTFWYSAIEGEVYASASMFTALLIWLIVKWESDFNNPRANRWLIVIAFIIGISVGSHMMVLLAIPTLCYIYYAKRYTITIKNFIIANLVTLVILAFVFKFIFPFVMKIFGKTEIFLVNELSLPFNSGLFVALFGFVLFFYLILKLFKKQKWEVPYVVTLAIIFMLIGFSSWLVIPIRANANPPMNLNNPDNALGMLDFYNREQYGDWPILKGANYTAFIDKGGIKEIKNTDPIYEKNENTGRYDEVGKRFEYIFNERHVSFLPRMYYPQNDNKVQDNYGMIAGYPKVKINESLDEYPSEVIQRVSPSVTEKLKEFNAKIKTGDISIDDYKEINDMNEQIKDFVVQFQERNDWKGPEEPYILIEKPTLGQNIEFMFTYQFHEMFIRYLMWNFVGRQNDKEWQYDAYKGNWEDGAIWSSADLPASFQTKAMNHYYWLPFILGLIGFFFHINYDFGRMYALLALFLLTGFGIILYTSVKPFEPRERDYALVSAFYAFAIWIGLGAGLILHLLRKITPKSGLQIAGFTLLLGVPLLMGFQNWDDHDRSHRYTAYDQAYSYLKPLGKEAIVFVYGDNDTYPLWALQETAGIRNDVKVVNTTLLGTSWYIDQVRRKTYKSPPIPGDLKHEEYVESINDQIAILKGDELKSIFTNDTVKKNMLSNGIDVNSFSDLLPYAKDSMTAKEAIAFLRKNSTGKTFFATTFYNTDSKEFNFIPTNKIVIPVNKANCLKYGIVAKEDAHLMVDNIIIETKGSFGKAELTMLDMFANYNWDRPIYFGMGGGMSEGVFFLQNYLEYQGFVYKLVPILTKRNEDGDFGRINTNNIYNIIKQFRWGNFKDPKAHFDQTGLNNIVYYRQAVGRAVKALHEKGEIAKAKELLELINKEIPVNMYPGTTSLNDIISGYILVGEEQKGLQMAEEYKKTLFEELDYYMKLPAKKQYYISNDMDRAALSYVYLVESVVKAYEKIGKAEKSHQYAENSYIPFEKKIEASLGQIKGDESRKEQQYTLSTLIGSFNALNEVIKPIDSLLVHEKEFKIQGKLKSTGF